MLQSHFCAHQSSQRNPDAGTLSTAILDPFFAAADTLARNAEGTTLQVAENERVDPGYAPFLENFKSPTAQWVEGMNYLCPSPSRTVNKCSLL